jgi:drug/metabolite transporter (DMT)-like permease
MTRRGWALFFAQGLIWGFPYLLIKEAVATIEPVAVVAGRTGLAALILMPLAARAGALRPALAEWRVVLVFTAIEIGGPFLLLADAEQVLPSGLTGLLVSTVPLFGMFTAFALGDRTVLRVTRVAGLLIGLAGVALILSGDHGDGVVRAWNVVEVLLVAVGYSIAPFVAHHRLGHVPGLGLAAFSVAIAGAAYLPAAAVAQEHWPSARSSAAVGGLALVCTALAFVTFFALIEEVGPARSTLITYVNPVVALTLGVVLLDESLTTGLLIGFPIVLLGCWLAASHEDDDVVVVPEASPLTDAG